jgi:Dolichyl-phosphate-mannose-protein mannosyltransferase
MTRKWLFIPLILVGVAYFIARAVMIPMVVDEVCTLDRFVFQRFGQIYTFDGLTTDMVPNNHLLNSWLTKISLFIFGNTPLALRSPNILAGLLALLAGWGIATKLGKSWLVQLAIFLLIFSNLFVAEFFSLTRGYGLAHAAIVISFWAWLQYASIKTHFWLVVGLLFSGFAFMSHLTTVNVLATMGGLLMLSALFEKSYRKAALVFSIVLAIVALMTPFVLKVIASNQAFGGLTGFYVDVVENTCRNVLFYHLLERHVMTLVVLVIGLFGLCVSGSIFSWYKDKHALQKPEVFATGLLTGTILLILIECNFLGVPFPRDRTSLFLVPMFGIMVGSWLGKLEQSQAKTAQISAAFLAVLISAHLIFGANLTDTRDYYFDAHTYDAIEVIAADLAKNPLPRKAKISVVGTNQASFAYHLRQSKYADKIDLPDFIPLGSDLPAADYYFEHGIYFDIKPDTFTELKAYKDAMRLCK